MDSDFLRLARRVKNLEGLQGGYPDQKARDAVGEMLEDTASVSLSYSGGKISASANIGTASGQVADGTLCADKATAPAANSDQYVPQWDGANSKTLKNGKALSGADNKVITGTPAAGGDMAMWNADGDIVGAALAASAAPECGASNQLIQHGWGYVQGNGTNHITQSVTFPITFDDEPVIVPSDCAARMTNAGTPTGQAWFTSPAAAIIDKTGVGLSGFTIHLWGQDASASFSASYYYGYSWIAIGTKTR